MPTGGALTFTYAKNWGILNGQSQVLTLESEKSK